MEIQTLRTLLVVDIVAMAAIAFWYLRQRRLTWQQYCLWGLLALLVPLLGPFLVIISRPGAWRAPSPTHATPRPVTTRLFALLGPRRRLPRRAHIPPSQRRSFDRETR